MQYNPFAQPAFIDRIKNIIKNNETKGMRAKNPSAYNNLLFHIKNHPEFYAPLDITTPEQLVEYFKANFASELQKDYSAGSAFLRRKEVLQEEVKKVYSNGESTQKERYDLYQTVCNEIRRNPNEYEKIGIKTAMDFIYATLGKKPLNPKKNSNPILEELRRHDIEKKAQEAIDEAQKLAKLTNGFQIISLSTRNPKLYQKIRTLILSDYNPFGDDVKTYDDFLEKYCHVKRKKPEKPLIDNNKEDCLAKINSDPKNIVTYIVEYCLTSGKDPKQALENLGLVLPEKFVTKIEDQYDLASK